MAISVVGSSGWQEVTNDIVFTLPSSQEGDRLYLLGTWKDHAVTLATPTDWTLGSSGRDGTVASGNGVGSMRYWWGYRDVGASAPSNPTLDFSAAIIGGVCCIALRKGTTETWNLPVFQAAAITNWTTTSQTVSAPPLTVADASVVMGLAGIRDDSATFTRPTNAIDGASITWNGNFVQLPATHLSTTTGNDMAASAGYRLVTTGGALINLTQTATLSAAETGIALWVVQSVTDSGGGDNNVYTQYVGGGYYG